MGTHRITIDPREADRAALTRALHTAGPVAEVDLAGVTAFAVTHHEALRTVLTDRTDTFVRGNAEQHWRALRDGEIEPSSPLVRLVSGGIGSLLTAHGADHARLRKPMQTHFTRRRVEALRPRIEELAAELLDGVEDAGGDGVDIKDRFAWPLTVGVLVELMGLSPEEAPVLGDIARRLFELTDPTVFRDAPAFLGALVQRRRDDPTDDLVGALVAGDDAAAPEDRLGDAQLVANLFLLVVAGFETTMGTLTNGVRALLDHPDQLARLTGGEVEWSTGVEEVLRRFTSVSLLPTVFTARATELAGVSVPEGALLLLGYGPAGLDAAAWESPEAFDVGRDARGHFAFGHGPHLCLGAPLARLELNVALPALFARFPGLALDDSGDSATPVASWMMSHPQELWVRPTGTA